MSTNNIKFERTKIGNSKASYAFIDKEFLPFKKNKADRDLAIAQEHTLACHVQGNPGDGIKITGTSNGTKVLEFELKIENGKDRAFDSKTFKF